MRVFRATGPGQSPLDGEEGVGPEGTSEAGRAGPESHPPRCLLILLEEEKLKGAQGPGSECAVPGHGGWVPRGYGFLDKVAHPHLQ